mmetsp:Transcript_6065/g.18861  ORF Transcript_6065/g.18861 Transcript_6065/m.18861 type:complete len:407 (-) Transcript_6065:755-1975(-)
MDRPSGAQQQFRGACPDARGPDALPDPGGAAGRKVWIAGGALAAALDRLQGAEKAQRRPAATEHPQRTLRATRPGWRGAAHARAGGLAQLPADQARAGTGRRGGPGPGGAPGQSHDSGLPPRRGACPEGGPGSAVRRRLAPGLAREGPCGQGHDGGARRRRSGFRRLPHPPAGLLRHVRGVQGAEERRGPGAARQLPGNLQARRRPSSSPAAAPGQLPAARRSQSSSDPGRLPWRWGRQLHRGGGGRHRRPRGAVPGAMDEARSWRRAGRHRTGADRRRRRGGASKEGGLALLRTALHTRARPAAGGGHCRPCVLPLPAATRGPLRSGACPRRAARALRGRTRRGGAARAAAREARRMGPIPDWSGALRRHGGRTRRCKSALAGGHRRAPPVLRQASEVADPGMGV